MIHQLAKTEDKMKSHPKNRISLSRVGMMEKGHYLKNTRSSREVLLGDDGQVKALHYRKDL